MGFRSYLVFPTGPNSWRLESPEPCKLSGANGWIAGYVLADQNRATQPWRLTARDLLRQFQSSRTDTGWIVFEQIEAGEVRLSRLERIAGVSAARTDLLLTLSALVVTRIDSVLSVKETPNGRSWSEELALEGGVYSPQRSWRWCESTLNIGATVVGPHT